jgi:putative redox protein
MAERVIIKQNIEFATQILAADPHEPDSDEFHPVSGVHQLTPYGMLLAGLGTCTTIVVNTYAQNHGVPLDDVEIRLEYDRYFGDDCEECESIDEYREQIREEIVFNGDLTPEQRKRLFAVSQHCPIHKMLVHGIEVKSRLESSAGWVSDPPVRE